MKHGLYTAGIGERLHLEFAGQYEGIELVYDHGREGSHKAVPFLGRRSSNASSLSHADIVVLDKRKKPKKAVVVCEIEEGRAEPKRIIGDICNVLLARKLRAVGSDYSLLDCVVILGIKTEAQGMSEAKARRLVKAISKMAKSEMLQRKRITLVSASDFNILERRVEKAIRRAVAQAV